MTSAVRDPGGVQGRDQDQHQHPGNHPDQGSDNATDDHQPARWHFRLDGADYLAESDGHQWSLTARAPPAPADVTITATAQALTTLIFAGSDADIDITGKPRAVERFRRLISTMAAVVQPG